MTKQSQTESSCVLCKLVQHISIICDTKLFGQCSNKNLLILSNFFLLEKNNILHYKNQGIHYYPSHPTFLWKINITLVWRLISILIWDISGQWNRTDGWIFREKTDCLFKISDAIHYFSILYCASDLHN